MNKSKPARSGGSGEYSISRPPAQKTIQALRDAWIIDHLSITMKSLVTVRQAEQVASLTGVKRIRLRSAITRGALSRPIRIPHPEELDLFASHGPGRLAGFEHAESLAVIRTYFMTDADLRAISRAPVLRLLMARHVPVTATTLALHKAVIVTKAKHVSPFFQLFLTSHPRSPLGVRLHGGPHLREGRLLHLPLYAAGSLHRLTFPPTPETL